jgi:hypothetical protein
MKVTISTTDEFDRRARRLAKKYKSLKDDLRTFQQEIMENPLMGIDLGRGVRKIRMAITSKGKGKSGGARVITYAADIIVQQQEGELILLSIYDKSNQSTISDKEIKRLKSLIGI